MIRTTELETRNALTRIKTNIDVHSRQRLLTEGPLSDGRVELAGAIRRDASRSDGDQMP